MKKKVDRLRLCGILRITHITHITHITPPGGDDGMIGVAMFG
jgi:hypothetical protein